MHTHFLSSITNFFTALISPPYCMQCCTFLSERIPLCPSCADQLKPMLACTLEITATRSMPVYALAPYEGAIRSLIIAKHYGARYAGASLGTLMAKHLVCPWHEYDLLVPVPLHWTRYTKRGFNQAKVIAQKLSETTHVPVHCGLHRARRTAYQTSASRTGRFENVSGAFTIDEKTALFYRDKRILLVDDLMTTGATLRAAAKALNVCKPAQLGAIVAARVI